MDACRVLGLSERVLVALRKVMRAVDIHSRKLVHSYSLTTPQLILLREIERSSEIAIGELARRTTVSNATATGIVDRLEHRGLVKRRRNGKDRRVVLVTCTERAKELLNAAPPLLQERFLTELGKLHEWEQAQILSSLERVACMMHAEHLDVAPVLASYPLDASAEDTLLPQGTGGPVEPTWSVTVKGAGDGAGGEFKIREIRVLRDLAAGEGVQELAEFLHQALVPYNDTLEDIASGIRDALEGGGFVLVGEGAGKMAGALVMLRTGMRGYVPENLLLFVAVAEPMRGNGLGKLLVERALNLAAGEVKLHVEYSNPARRLYERAGFTSKYAEMRYKP